MGGKVALAADEAPDEFALHLENGERRIDGTIKSINVGRGTFVVDATSVSYPSGLPKQLDTPVSMLVANGNKTYFHVRGDDDTPVDLSDVHVKDSVVVIAVYSTAYQKWNANEVAVWTRQEKGQYVLEGLTTQEPETGNNGRRQTVRGKADTEQGREETTDEVGGAFPAPYSMITDWEGENSGVDVTGDMPGILQNGATFEPGMVGSALSFDGVDDRFAVKDAPDLILTKSLTIESWLFIKPSNTTGMIIIRGDNRSGLDPYALNCQPDGTVGFHIGSETENADLHSQFPIGVWVHVAATLDDDTGLMRLYKNGQKVAEARTRVRPLGMLSPQDGAGLGIGNVPALPNTPHNFPFHGLVDEMSLYAEALSPEVIRGIYEAGAAGKGPSNPLLIIPIKPGDMGPDEDEPEPIHPGANTNTA